MNNGLIFHILEHIWKSFKIGSDEIRYCLLNYNDIIKILTNFIQSTNNNIYDCKSYIYEKGGQDFYHDITDEEKNKILDKTLSQISYRLIKLIFHLHIKEDIGSCIGDRNTSFEQNLESISQDLGKDIVSIIRENKTKYIDLLISLYMKSILYKDVYCHDTETILYKLGLQNVIADRELKNHAWDRSCSFIDDMDFSSEVWSHCYQKGYSISASIASRKYDKLYE